MVEALPLFWVAAIPLFLFVLLPTTVYLCSKAGAVGYWAGFTYCVRHGIIPLERDDSNETR